MTSDAPQDYAQYYKHLSLFWNDLIHMVMNKPQALTSFGPMRNMGTNTQKITSELIEMNEDLVEFNKYLTEYFKQLSDTWNEAQKKVNLKAPEIPQDAENFDAYKRVWIDIFDNDFTELFDSKEFGENYGKLVSKELDLTNRWTKISNVALQAANLPSKKEIDELYKELHSLRRRVSKMETELTKRKGSTNETRN